MKEVITTAVSSVTSKTPERSENQVQKKWYTRSKMFMAIAFAGMSSLGTSQAMALSFSPSSDLSIDLDTTVSYGASWRVESQDSDNLSNPNEDDANRNFDTGVVSSLASVISDIDLSYKNFGLFVRARAFYDDAYYGDNDNDSSLTANNGPLNSGSLNNYRGFTSETKEVHGSDPRLLDYFLYGSFELSGRAVNVRIGDQVVSWGETLFLPNGINSATAIVDATKLNVPGLELKEVFLPVGQVYAQVDLTDSLTLEAYYQYEWEETRLDAVGSYFSTVDFLVEGGENILVPAVAVLDGITGGHGVGPAAALGIGSTTSPFATIDRGDDSEASDSGQWGLAVRYLASGLNDTEFGFYYVNYHDKTPMLNLNAATGGTDEVDWFAACFSGPAAADCTNPNGMGGLSGALHGIDMTTYTLEYVEDIHLFGFSASAVLGDTNVAADISYRANAPVVTANVQELLGPRLYALSHGLTTDTLIKGYERANTMHYDISAIHIFGPTSYADNTVLTVEAAMDVINGFDSDDLLRVDLRPATKSSWGYQANLELSYDNVVSGVDVKIPVSISHGVNGVSPIGAGFVEGRKSANIGVIATYLNNLQASIKYTAFWGRDGDNLLSDRDFMAFSIKYSF